MCPYDDCNADIEDLRSWENLGDDELVCPECKRPIELEYDTDRDNVFMWFAVKRKT